MTTQHNQLEVHKSVDLLVEDDKRRGQDWYKALCEEVDATRVETMYNAMDTLLGGKLAIGKLISEHTEYASPTELVRQIALDLKIGERDLWYCYKFYENYDTIKKLPIFATKAISWSKIKAVISEPHKKEVEHHESCLHIEKIIVCKNCGDKLSDED